jgi:ribosome-binding factor A
MLGSTIQKELALIIMRELHDPRLTGLPSITRVNVSADLSVADVFVTIMGTPGQQTAALNALRHSAGLMRTRLTKALTLRVAPYIKFHFDEDLKKELEIMELLDKVRRENEELDRKRAEAAAAEAQAAGAQGDGAQADGAAAPAQVPPAAVAVDAASANAGPPAADLAPGGAPAAENDR